MSSSNFSSKDYINIDRILKRKKISKTELANRLGVPRQSIYSYLKGNVSLEKIVNMANALDVELWELFSRSGDDISGFIEYKGEIHRVHSKQDLENLLKLIDNES